MSGISNFDFNLLIAFDALMTEKNVSRAAAKLGITQPALSQSLRRLRDSFKDELFVRGRNGMQPTPRALSLYEPIHAALDQCQSIIASDVTFDATSSRRTFTLAMSDQSAALLMPPVMRDLRIHAPHVDVRIVTGGRIDLLERLVSGEIDLALGIFPQLPPGLTGRVLLTDKLLCIADKNNAFLRNGAMDFDTYLQCPHVTVAFDRQSGFELDEFFTKLRIKRRVAAVLPHYLAIPRVIRGTDLVGHIRSQATLSDLDDWSDFALFSVPSTPPVPDLVFHLVWHKRKEQDAGHQWIRRLVDKCAGSPP